MGHRICTSKHQSHIRHLRRVHRDRLVKRRGFTKHAIHSRHLRRVHRNRLIKRRGTTKHATHIRHLRRVHRDRLVKRRGFTKHARHIRHLRRVHRDRLIKRRGTRKHATHIRHLLCVPLINRCVKILHSLEQKRHVRHKRDIPSIWFAVILHASIVLRDPLLQLRLCRFLKEEVPIKEEKRWHHQQKKCQFEKINF